MEKTPEEEQKVGEEVAAEEAPAEEVPTAPGQELSMIRLKELMNKVNNSWAEGHTEITHFTEMYFEWTKLFRHFGNAVAVAFKGKSFSYSLNF